ncbi:MAG: hypothetical protein LBG92_10045, partial [Prevotellaceae bacterium]|nr:hypothetical protein [Prevotellaceae bacterium]
MKKFFLLVFISVGFITGRIYSQDYKNPKLPVEQRVENLMSLMTLEEKVNQLQSQLTFLHE